MNRRNEIVAGSLFLMAVFMAGTGTEAFRVSSKRKMAVSGNRIGLFTFGVPVSE